MRIAAVEPLPVGRFLLVRVHTDEGVTGIGEAGAWGLYDAAAAMIRTIGVHLVGEDPFRIEHHWQYARRQSHYRGSALMAAISAIDIALWDLKGRALGLPIWQLLSGGVRHMARAYRHVMAGTKKALVAGVREAKDAGYTAVGHLTPFLDEAREAPFMATHAGRIAEAAETVSAYREAAGRDVDLCIELHRRMSVPESLVLLRELEACRPMFVEDPIRPDNLDAMAALAAASPVPIATGERLTSPEEFAMLLDRGACHYLRPSPGLVGGITGAMKVAALAEAKGLPIVPHNPFGPVMTAACVQIAASAPNVAIVEYSGKEHNGPRRSIVAEPIAVRDGFLVVPDGPGLGVELVQDPAAAWPPEPRAFVTRLHVDGSVVDQ